MMKRLVLLALLFPLLCPGPALAAEKSTASLTQVVGALEKPFRKETSGPAAITDFQGEFSQVSRFASLNQTQKGKGTVSVQLDRTGKDERPMPKFRWHYDTPSPQEIVSNGRTLWVYQPESQQVIESKIAIRSHQQAGDPLLFLTELGHLSTVFHIAWADPKRDDHDDFLLELVPKQPTPLLKRLLIAVRPEALGSTSAKDRPIFPIAATTVFDVNDNSTLIRFHGVRVNLALPAATFHFQVPKGVEVLHSMPQFNPKGSE